MLSNMSVRNRMILTCGMLGVLFAVVLVLAFKLAADQSSVARTAGTATTEVRDSLDLSYRMADMNGWQTAYALDVERDGPAAAKDTASSRAAFITAAQGVAEGLDTLGAQNLTTAERALLERARAAYDEFMAVDETIATQYRSGDPAQIEAASVLVLGKEIELYNTMAAAAAELADLVIADARAAEDTAVSGSSRAQWIVILLAIVGVVLGVILVIAMTRSVTVPLADLRDRLRSIGSSGKGLQARLDASRRDEFGEVAQAFNTFVTDLDRSLRQVSEHAQTVAAASEELAAVSEELSATAADSASRTATISDSAAHVASNAGLVDGRAGDTASVAQDAVSVSNELATVVSSLGHRSTDIEGMTRAIKDITEQIDLLALNATIEAARAGDAGRSFAVVAAEVKGLANASATTTKDVTSALVGIRSDVESVLTSLQRMSQVVGEADRHARDITVASSGQRHDAARMAEEAAALAASVDQTRSAAGDVSKASHELASLATSLNTLVTKYSHA